MTTFSVSGGSECSAIGKAGDLRQIYFLRGDIMQEKQDQVGGGVGHVQ